MADLSAFALNCTLKASPATSSTDRMLDLVEGELGKAGVALRRTRVADHRVRPGVTSDEGDGDEWPQLRTQILGAQLFVLATPIWLGHPASNAQRVLERLDAFLGETDDAGRMISIDRVAMVAVVGNEDGAHFVGSQLYQGLNDVGFTIAANAQAYWVGEAMQGTDFVDLAEVPEEVTSAVGLMVRNAVHLARVLQGASYPAG